MKNTSINYSNSKLGQSSLDWSKILNRKDHMSKFNRLAFKYISEGKKNITASKVN